MPRGPASFLRQHPRPARGARHPARCFRHASCMWQAAARDVRKTARRMRSPRTLPDILGTQPAFRDPRPGEFQGNAQAARTPAVAAALCPRHAACFPTTTTHDPMELIHGDGARSIPMHRTMAGPGVATTLARLAFPFMVSGTALPMRASAIAGAVDRDQHPHRPAGPACVVSAVADAARRAPPPRGHLRGCRGAANKKPRRPGGGQRGRGTKAWGGTPVPVRSAPGEGRDLATGVAPVGAYITTSNMDGL